MKFFFKKLFLVGLFFNLFILLYNIAVYRILFDSHVQSTPQLGKQPTIFCMILTSVKSLNVKTKTIYETWGKKCDNYKFITLLPSDILTINQGMSKKFSIEINNGYDILQPPGLVNDSYGMLTNKVLLTYKYLYNKYNDYDWYLKADDDTFIFVDNLRQFVADKNSSSPVTFGYDFKVYIEKGYHSGGGGYLLSTKMFSNLVILL